MRSIECAGERMAWLFDIWALLFWIPVAASAATGWLVLERAAVARPIPLALWFLTSLLLQFASEPLSMTWAAGMVCQTALAICLCVQLKLHA